MPIDIRTEFTFEQALEAAMNGAEWLDKNHAGWERKIDPALLDLNLSTQCILGQTIGFDRVADKMGDVWIAHHGFTVTYDIQCGRPQAWSMLTEAWLMIVKLRFDTGALSDVDS